MNNFFNIKPETRALIVFFTFLVIGIFVWEYFNLDWKKYLPLALFYLTIDINTYFSIVLFTRIIPKGMIEQDIFDIILVALYIGLAFSLGNPLMFAFLILFIFIVATIKYAQLLNVINQPKLLKRKITIDLCGVMMGALSVGGILAGYQNYSMWLLAIVFIIVNIFLLLIWPMYVADKQDSTI